jgi:hypothetical protein
MTTKKLTSEFGVQCGDDSLLLLQFGPHLRNLHLLLPGFLLNVRLLCLQLRSLSLCRRFGFLYAPSNFLFV